MRFRVVVGGEDIVMEEEEERKASLGEDGATDDMYSSERARTRVLLVVEMDREGPNDGPVHNRQ